MKTYDVYLHTVASTTIRVEAEDPDDAIEQAYATGTFPQICAQCSGWGKDYNLDLGDEWEPSGDTAEGAVWEVSE